MLTLTRAVVAAQIELRLTGHLDDAGLAAWAFQQFYAVESGRVELEAGAEPLLMETLDILMFADTPAFGLGGNALQALVQQLEEP